MKRLFFITLSLFLIVACTCVPISAEKADLNSANFEARAAVYGGDGGPALPDPFGPIEDDTQEQQPNADAQGADGALDADETNTLTTVIIVSVIVVVTAGVVAFLVIKRKK